MEETQQELKELIIPTEVTISEVIYHELRARTIKQQSVGEFWVFLVGKDGIATKAVEVGKGSESDVGTSAEEIISILAPFIEEGYQVISDYHNHPDSCLKVYQSVGLPPEFVVAPSGADLDRNIVPQAICSQLRQKPHPKIIGSFLADTKQFILNCFSVQREPSGKEIDSFSFYDPDFTPLPQDEIEVQIISNLYTDPTKLGKLDIVKPASIKVLSSNGNINNIQNAYTID